MVVAPSPVVELNRAVALAEVEGPDAALGVVDTLNLEGYYVYHSIRADLLRRRGRDAEAALAYERALALTEQSSRARAPWSSAARGASAVALERCLKVLERWACEDAVGNRGPGR